MRPTEKFELLILGQGSAALAAAIKANESKIKTAMVGGIFLGTTATGSLQYYFSSTASPFYNFLVLANLSSFFISVFLSTRGSWDLVRTVGGNLQM